jgi:hypothetical protein
VEQGSIRRALHLNLLHDDAVLAEIAGASTWTATDIENHRRVAAYISKREQAPDRRSFHGRTFGTFGDLWYYAARASRSPPVAAAAWQFAIDPGAAPRAELDLLNRSPTPPLLTRAEYHAIAARWLPDLIDLVDARPI